MRRLAPLVPGLRGRLDPALCAYGVVAVLVAVQVVALGATDRTLRAAVPYLAAAVVLAALTRTPAGAGRHPEVSDDDTRVVWGLEALTLGGGALGVWAVARFALALPSALAVQDGFYRVKTQVTSPLGDHNTLAGLLVVAVVAGFALAQRDRRFLLPAVVSCVGIVACLSRGGALVLVLVALVAAAAASTPLLRRTLPVAAVLTLVGVLVAALVLGAAPPPGTAPAEGAMGASVLARADLAVRGLEVAAERPWIGAGLGSFQEIAVGLPEPNGHAHQLLVQAAAEGGVVLLAVVVALPVVLLRRAARLRPSVLRDTALLGGGGLVLHAQIEILGGRLGYELVLAALIALTGLAGRAGVRGVSVDARDDA